MESCSPRKNEPRVYKEVLTSDLVVMFFGKSLQTTFSSNSNPSGNTVFLNKKHVYHLESVNKMSLEVSVENMSVCQ